MNFRVKLLILGAAAATSVMAFSPDVPRGSRPVRQLVRFQELNAVYGPALGSACSRNEMVGARLPWTIREAEGTLDSAGRVHARIRGLVLADSPDVPDEWRGNNNQPRFRVVLVCQTKDEEGRPVSAQLATEGFPATESGDCRIDAVLQLPRPCARPVLFITGVDDTVWLARSSGGTPEDQAARQLTAAAAAADR